MKTRTTVILFGLFIILLVFVYLFEGPLSEQARKKAQGTPLLFTDFPKDAATKIAVKSTGKEISLEKQADTWLISATDGFIADTQAVNNALDTIAGFKRESIASKNPEKQEIFEVTPAKGVEVKVFDAEEKILAHFYIGKTGPDFFSTYLRKEGSNEVLQLGSITSTFDKTIESWRDKAILRFPPDMATRLTLKTSQGETVVEKNEKDEWYLTKPEPAKAKQEMVTTIATTLSSLNALGFAEDYDWAKYGLDQPQLTVTVILKDQIEQRLTIGKKDEEKAQFYAKNEAKKPIFLIGKYQFDTLNKTCNDLKEEEKKEGEEKEAAKDTSTPEAQKPSDTSDKDS